MDAGYINFYGERVSLMVADSDAELHAMARELGLQRAVFPAGRSHVYYIPGEARDKTLSLGAVLVEREVVLSKLRRKQ